MPIADTSGFVGHLQSSGTVEAGQQGVADRQQAEVDLAGRRRLVLVEVGDRLERLELADIANSADELWQLPFPLALRCILGSHVQRGFGRRYRSSIGEPFPG